MILSRTSAEEAETVADRLREAIAADGDEPAVTVSAGVATFPLDAADPDALIRAADEALYASKRRAHRVTRWNMALPRCGPAGEHPVVTDRARGSARAAWSAV